jgi:hypothetical protein
LVPTYKLFWVLDGQNSGYRLKQNLRHPINRCDSGAPAPELIVSITARRRSDIQLKNRKQSRVPLEGEKVKKKHNGKEAELM